MNNNSITTWYGTVRAFPNAAPSNDLMAFAPFGKLYGGRYNSYTVSAASELEFYETLREHMKGNVRGINFEFNMGFADIFSRTVTRSPDGTCVSVVTRDISTESPSKVIQKIEKIENIRKIPTQTWYLTALAMQPDGTGTPRGFNVKSSPSVTICGDSEEEVREKFASHVRKHRAVKFDLIDVFSRTLEVPIQIYTPEPEPEPLPAAVAAKLQAVLSSPGWNIEKVRQLRDLYAEAGRHDSVAILEASLRDAADPIVQTKAMYDKQQLALRAQTPEGRLEIAREIVSLNLLQTWFTKNHVTITTVTATA